MKDPDPSGAGSDQEKPVIQCPLCGHKFREGAKTACSVCPLHYGKCHFEKCPHCGYDIPQGSVIWTGCEVLWRKIKQWFQRGIK